mgnify:CR=1 FL=1
MKTLTRSKYLYFALIHQAFVVSFTTTVIPFVLVYLLISTEIPGILIIMGLLLGASAPFFIPGLTLIITVLLSWYVALWIRGRYTLENPSRYLLFCAGYVAIHFLGFTYFFPEDYLSYLTPFGSFATTWMVLRKVKNQSQGSLEEEGDKNRKINTILTFIILAIVGIFIVLHIVSLSYRISKERMSLSCAGFDVVIEEETISNFENAEYTVRLYYHTAGTEKFIWDLDAAPYTAITPSDTPLIVKIADQPLGIPWSIYVASSKFSRYEFDQIAECLSIQHGEFINLVGQTERFGRFAWEGLGVAELIYSDTQ